MSGKVTFTVEQSQVDYYIKALGRMRCWNQGFKAAGGLPPHDDDELRRLQIFFGSPDKKASKK